MLTLDTCLLTIIHLTICVLEFFHMPTTFTYFDILWNYNDLLIEKMKSSGVHSIGQLYIDTKFHV